MVGPLTTTTGGDIARHQAAEDPGPAPIVRAVLGLGVGAAVGVLAALLTPRPDRARRQAALGRAVDVGR